MTQHTCTGGEGSLRCHACLAGLPRDPDPLLDQVKRQPPAARPAGGCARVVDLEDLRRRCSEYLTHSPTYHDVVTALLELDALRAGDDAAAVANALERVKREGMSEALTMVRRQLLDAAAGHGDLARRYPTGADRAKEEGLRRFADTYLPDVETAEGAEASHTIGRAPEVRTVDALVAWTTALRDELTATRRALDASEARRVTQAAEIHDAAAENDRLEHERESWRRRSQQTEAVHSESAVDRAAELIRGLNAEGLGRVVHGALQVAIFAQARTIDEKRAEDAGRTEHGNGGGSRMTDDKFSRDAWLAQASALARQLVETADQIALLADALAAAANDGALDGARVTLKEALSEPAPVQPWVQGPKGPEAQLPSCPHRSPGAAGTSVLQGAPPSCALCELDRLRASSTRACVREFKVAVGQPVLETPEVPPADRLRLYVGLVVEEALEIVEAVFSIPGDDLRWIKRRLTEIIRTAPVFCNLAETADGIVDTKYVLEGLAHECGIDTGPVLAVVHAANMQKIAGPVDPETGKKLKPPGWTPPDVHAELVRQGYRP